VGGGKNSTPFGARTRKMRSVKKESYLEKRLSLANRELNRKTEKVLSELGPLGDSPGIRIKIHVA